MSSPSAAAASSCLKLPPGCAAVSWRVEAGASVRAGDVLGHCTGGLGGGDGPASGSNADATSTSSGGGGGGKSAGGGLIRPKKRSRPRPQAAATQGGAAATAAAAAAAVAAGPKKKAGGGGVSLGSLVAGLGRTDSTLTGGSGGGDDGGAEAPPKDDGSSTGAGGTTGGSSASAGANGGAGSASAVAAAATTTNTSAASTHLVAPADGILRIVGSNSPSDGIVGYVEPCHHPAVIDGLCAVCGSPVDRAAKNDGSAAAGDDGDASTSEAAGRVAAMGIHPGPPSSLHSHPTDKSPGGTSSSSHLTVSGGLTISISQSEAKSIASDSSARLRSAKKLSLVLDLDHTLLHATADPRAEAYVARSCLLLDDENRRRRREDVRTLVLPMLEGAAPSSMSHVNVTQIHEQPIPAPLRHYVKLRPHLARFLTEACERYELTIYTAGTRSYAHKVAHVISRHIVGARLDEEELNNLRRSLAAAEERARWHEARMKRRRYVEGLNQKVRASAAEEEEETQIREDVSMIFDDMEEEEEETGEAEAK
jgi:hypothetical protein